MKSLKVRSLKWLLSISVVAATPVIAAAQSDSVQDQVAELKQSLQANQASLRRYQWMETTTVSLKGDVKSVKQSSCYYGADGKVQKTEVSESQAPQPSGGRLKQRVIAHKKEEMTDYMQRAVELVHHYVPPDPNMINYSKSTNNIAREVVAPGLIKLKISNFYKPGDVMTIGLNMQAKSITDINVSTYLDDPKDAITLAVSFSNLPDGTSFTKQTVLNAPDKHIQAVVLNSGYRSM